MASFVLNVNGNEYKVEADPATPLLWVLRDNIGLVGTKYGCGIAQCGACMVHLNGQPVVSCNLPVAAAQSARVTTIEGLSEHGDHPVQEAWIETDVPQCGYCQAGQIMTVAALLRENPDPTDDDIDRAMSGHLCRCTTYLRIRKAIHLAAQNSR